MIRVLVAHAVAGNTQRLDGGAMFGNVPRVLWSRWCEPDAAGTIPLACRCLLIDDGRRKILFETGIGAFFEPAHRARFGVVEDRHVLLDSLGALGVSHEDIELVVLSHLHFDHAGGLLAAWREGEPPRLLFPNARYLVGREAYERANAPHPRDRASFIAALPELLVASGRLEIVDGERSALLGDAFSFTTSHGHTPGMMHARIQGRDGSLFFCADLVPGTAWVHLPVTMGYDRFPEKLIDEKAALYERALAERTWLFFTHDVKIAAARVGRDASGRYGAIEARAELGFDLDAPQAQS